MQGASHRTESGASGAPRGWQHAAVAGCHLECGEMLLVEAGFRPKPGDLETPQVGNSAELCWSPYISPLAMPFRVAMRLWEKVPVGVGERAASLNRKGTRPDLSNPILGFLEKKFCRGEL